MDTLRDFWANWGPWIMLSLIPTLIAGLSTAPQTKHLADAAEKAVSYFKQAMGFFSIATFKDVPGTFKAPLTKAKTETVSMRRDTKPLTVPAARPPSLPGGTTLLVLFVLLSGNFSCAWLGASTDKAKQVMIDCTQAAVISSAPHLLPIVSAIVQSQSPDWKRMLEAIAKEMSRDVIACALQQTAIELQAKVPASGADGSPETRQVLTGMQRARQFLDEKNWEIQEQP